MRAAVYQRSEPGQIAHVAAQAIVDDQRGAGRSLGREEEIGAVAGPGGAVFQILGCEARGDGIAQGGTIDLASAINCGAC